MEMCFGLSKQTWRMGLNEQGAIRTPEIPYCMCFDVDLLYQNNMLRGQPRLAKASETPLILGQKGVKGTKEWFIYSYKTLDSIKNVCTLGFGMLNLPLLTHLTFSMLIIASFGIFEMRNQ